MDEYRLFYNRHKDKLFAYMMRMTGDYYLSGDIIQESFTKYLEHYKERALSVSLLYTIARNTFLDNIRRQKHDRPLNEEREDPVGNPEHDMMVREEYQQVLEAMQKLKDDEREILSIVLNRDLSYREIADILGISEGNVKVKVHRARISLKKHLQKGGG